VKVNPLRICFANLFFSRIPIKRLLNYYYYYLLIYRFTLNTFFPMDPGFRGVSLYARLLGGESVFAVDGSTALADSATRDRANHLEDQTLKIELPYPPSINHYWRRVGAKTLISKEGRRYREAVAAICQEQRISFGDASLSLSITAHPPDRRRRDLDNLLKAPLDAMQAAGVYQDDYQIEVIHLERGECVCNGSLIVEIEASEGALQCDSEDLHAELTKRADELRSALEATLEALATVSE
jgi:crossover junction endodeoxyribonuclease RusA